MEWVKELRDVVRQANRLVSPVVMTRLLELHARCLEDQAHEHHVAHLAPAYGAREQLLVVAACGQPASLDPKARLELERATMRESGLARWMRPSSETGVWVARWLCHLAGLRHRTVQLFIDHPHFSQATLVQIRSVDKAHYPGCLDIPAAGHVSGDENPRDALVAELAQELGLSARQLLMVVPIGGYEAKDDHTQTAMLDVEFRLVYAARLCEGAMREVCFADGEVAALAICDLDELQALLDRYPERAASGLRGSWPLYLAYRDRKGR